jgi:hypothetical protein
MVQDGRLVMVKETWILLPRKSARDKDVAKDEEWDS